MDRVKVLSLECEHGVHQCYLVGTAHISKASADDVEEVVQTTQPSAVVLELCRSRTALLFLTEEHMQQGNHLSFEAFRKHGVFQTCYTSFFNAVSKDLDVLPGQDFRTAYREALALQPEAQIILGDRPVTITLRRFWGSLGFFSKVR